MADQEFLASFAVEIDESGVEKLQKALTQNRELADELASAFDAAREAVGDFFKQLSASTLPTGELSPYQRLMDLSEGGFSFELDPDTSDAEEQLDTFLQQARNLFEETRFPLGADTALALSLAAESLQQLQDLFGSSVLPLGADALSGLPDLLASAPAAAAPVVNQTANNSVQAPVSINVTAAGTDPEAVGKSVYDVAEQYLLRTLRGAM